MRFLLYQITLLYFSYKENGKLLAAAPRGKIEVSELLTDSFNKKVSFSEIYSILFTFYTTFSKDRIVENILTVCPCKVLIIKANRTRVFDMQILDKQ